MTKKKKIIIVSSVILGPVVLFFLIILIMLFTLPLTNIKENKMDDAKRIAIEQFGMDEVWVVYPGSSGSTITTQESANLPIYVLGVKNGEELFIIVPQLKKYPAYEREWVFNTSFQDIVAKLNDFAGNTICSPDDYHYFKFIDNIINDKIKWYKTLDGVPLDVDFIMQYRYEYIIVQSNHEIMIFPEG